MTARQLTCALFLTASLVGAQDVGAQVFPGTGVGAIPDGGSGTPPQCGPARTISFAVTGATGTLQTVGVDLVVSPNHTWVGDLDVRLSAPGGAPSMVVLSRLGVQTAIVFGDDSNFGGPYRFSDGATGQNIWTAATTPACSDPCVVPAGFYRTTEPGGAGQTNPPPITSLRATFVGLTAAQTNGTWTLAIRDCFAEETGTVSAANLYLPDPLTDLIFIDGFEV